MKHDVSIDYQRMDDDIIEIIVKGTYIQKEAKSEFSNFVSSITKFGLKSVLVDMSQCKFKIDVMTTYKRPQDEVLKGKAKTFRVAFLHAQELGFFNFITKLSATNELDDQEKVREFYKMDKEER